MDIPWYRKYHSGKTLTENQERLVSRFDSEKDLESEIPLELLYGPTKVTVKQVASWLEFKEEHQRWPTYEEAFMDNLRPPEPPPTEYAYKKPPEPPKPRCIADESGYKSDIDRKLGKYMAWFSLLGLFMLMANLYEQHRLTEIKIHPKRTDHAVQAGIRECERSLPRTQTCELSQLSFKVVEKKGW